MSGVCSVHGCGLASFHAGPHDRTCTLCKGTGKAPSSRPCRACAGIGRTDVRRVAWEFNATTSSWYADLKGGWRRQGVTMCAWETPAGWRWNAKRQTSEVPYFEEMRGECPFRWQAMDNAEQAADDLLSLKVA